jgi:hypothetical protein
MLIHDPLRRVNSLAKGSDEEMVYRLDLVLLLHAGDSRHHVVISPSILHVLPVLAPEDELFWRND